MTPQAIMKMITGHYEKVSYGESRISSKRAEEIVKALFAQWHVPVRTPDAHEWKKLAIKYGTAEEYRLIVEALKIREESHI